MAHVFQPLVLNPTLNILITIFVKFHFKDLSDVFERHLNTIQAYPLPCMGFIDLPQFHWKFVITRIRWHSMEATVLSLSNDSQNSLPNCLWLWNSGWSWNDTTIWMGVVVDVVGRLLMATDTFMIAFVSIVFNFNYYQSTLVHPFVLWCFSMRYTSAPSMQLHSNPMEFTVSFVIFTLNSILFSAFFFGCSFVVILRPCCFSCILSLI